MAQPTPEIRTLGELYLHTKSRLNAAFSEDAFATPGLDARMIICSVMDLPAERVLIDRDLAVDQNIVTQTEDLINRRIQREPVARLVGYREFWGLEFSLSKETLVPRPETEGIIEIALEKLGQGNARRTPYRILDIGTGSGAIAVALLKEFENATIIATDISENALKTAHRNAKKYDVQNRFFPVCGDLGSMISGNFDLIVSNPPYIPESDRENLMPEVRLHDPEKALFAEEKGLAAIKNIAAFSFSHLKPTGVGVVEHGHQQQNDVHTILSDQGFSCIQCVLDMAKLPRFCVFSKKVIEIDQNR